MLTIRHIAFDEYFELDNVKIPMNIFNPFFEEQGSMSFSASMTAKSDINQRLANYPSQPGRLNNSGYKINVELFMNGVQKRCVMQILSADSANIKWNLQFDEGSFLAEHGETNIQDFDYDGEQQTPSSILPDWGDDYYLKTYPDVKVAFPLICDLNFFNGTDYEEIFQPVGAINIPANHMPVLELEDAPGVLQSHKMRVVAPTPFVSYVLEHIFNTLGYIIESNYFNTAELINMIILSANDSLEHTVKVEDGSFATFGSNARWTYHIANHLPSLTIKELLEALKCRFNVHGFIDDDNTSVRLVSLEQRIKEPVSQDLSEYFSKPVLKSQEDYTAIALIDAGEHSPRFDELVPDERSFSDDILPGVYTPDDLMNGIFKVSNIVLVYFEESDKHSYYRLIRSDDEASSEYEWSFLGNRNYGNYYSSIDETDNELKIETKATISPYTADNTTITVQTIGGLEEGESIVVKTINWNVEGNNLYISDEKSDVGFVLAFYNAYSEENETADKPEFGFLPPQAGNINRLSGEENTLYFDGEKGLIQKHWKNTFEMRMNRGRVFESIPSLPANLLFSLDTSKKYTIHGGTYFIKNIKANLLSNRIDYEASELMEA